MGRGCQRMAMNNRVRSTNTQANITPILAGIMASVYAQNMAPRDISSYMTFLSRHELYQTEKPYATDFPVEDIEGANMTNHIFDTRPITFHDARFVKEPFALDRNGFCYIKVQTSLQAEDATSEKTEQMRQYMQEIADILRARFPQYQEIKAMDFQVRISLH
jgi:hypothetical protein